jgi:hypothetical protein
VGSNPTGTANTKTPNFLNSNLLGVLLLAN